VFAYNVNLRDRTGYLAMAVVPWLHGRGVAVEAGGLFVSYMFSNWELRKLYGETVDFELQHYWTGGTDKLFHEEGRLRDHVYYGGRYWDMHLFAIYREEWAAFSGRLRNRAIGRKQNQGISTQNDAGSSSNGDASGQTSSPC